MLLLALALVSTPDGCVEITQRCRACPTDDNRGCSSVGIACQPIRRICEPTTPAKAKVKTGVNHRTATAGRTPR